MNEIIVFLENIITDAWSGLESIVNILNVILTLILTTIIIFQSKKISNRQIEFEKKYNEQQVEIQKNQLRVDTFSIKRKIFFEVSNILEFCHFINESLFVKELEIKSARQLYEIVILSHTKYVGESKDVFKILREAQFVYPKDSYQKIEKTRKIYDHTMASVLPLKILDKMMQSSDLEDQIAHSRSELESGVKSILEFRDYIYNELPKTFHISDID